MLKGKNIDFEELGLCIGVRDFSGKDSLTSILNNVTMNPNVPIAASTSLSVPLTSVANMATRTPVFMKWQSTALAAAKSFTPSAQFNAD